MFGKKRENYYERYCDAMNELHDWKRECNELKHEKAKLEHELEALRPIVESPHYKPAMSKDCADCKFVVVNRWNSRIVGCRKDNLCEDFVPAKTEE